MAVDATKSDNINNFTAAGKTAAAKSASEKASNQLFSNYQDFVKLLTVQLQNQDPTKPLETDQLTQQIASLSQVEQQINTNKNLEKLMIAFAQSQSASTVSYIGKLVESSGNQISLVNGEAVLVYSLDPGAETTQVTVTDTKGNVVYTGSGTTLAGRNQMIWDGTKDAGGKALDGTYKISVVAKDASNNAVSATTSSAGVVTAVETKDGVNAVALGDIVVPLDQVLSVRSMPTTI